ncbi:glycosyltransferase family 2 protein [Pseudoramibacter porci]|nr:glycosyltransferase [Pseudoramibacter porci]
MKRNDQDDVLMQIKKDRRLLAHVPDPTGERSTSDRRGWKDSKKETDADPKEWVERQKKGVRYMSDFKVKLTLMNGTVIEGRCIDISDTGILIRFQNDEDYAWCKQEKKATLKFHIPPGAMPEGHETRFKIAANKVRWIDESRQIAFQFIEDLKTFKRRHRDRYLLTMSAASLGLVSLCVVLMRAESVIYFKYNAILYLYSLIAAMFLLSRYFFGMLYKPVPIDPDFTPSVTVIIPCFNEEEWIQTTILSCFDQDYPPDKLKVIVVDDCSTDHSVEKIREIVEELTEQEDARYDVKHRLKYFVQEQNAGKRAALVRGVENTDTDLVMFVDSDSFLDPYAVRNLVQPFKEPKMGGCAGRCDVANTYTNSLTKMQSVRYYIAFRIMKAAEGYFDAVTCLSGPLSCYRRDIVMHYKDAWINQKFLGHKATFGDDRAMTNFVLRHHQCTYQDTAVCSTIVPKAHRVFLKQQMRWKRSWLRESLTAGEFMWRKEPFAMINFYIGLVVPMLAPAIVVYNLMIVPFTQHIFPKTFLLGLLLMSMMMSIAQLFFRKSSTWLFGFWFCVYYEVVLLWQMPIAWFTFWKSTWGTRMTPSDVKAKEKRDEKKKKKMKAREQN